MTKEENIIKYYVVCNRLKNVIRTGWKEWHVKRERLESIAEHIFGVQMLAIAMKSEYQYDVDLFKVLSLLAVHELGETLIGDFTPFQISKAEKEKIEREAVHKILKDLLDGAQIEQLFLEFDEGKTKEAQFAYQCDKLECDIQCKLYDEEGCVDLTQQEGNGALTDKRVQQLLDENSSWSTKWIRYDQQVCSYDENFKAVSNYVMQHEIGENSKQKKR